MSAIVHPARLRSRRRHGSRFATNRIDLRPNLLVYELVGTSGGGVRLKAPHGLAFTYSACARVRAVETGAPGADRALRWARNGEGLPEAQVAERLAAQATSLPLPSMRSARPKSHFMDRP